MLKPQYLLPLADELVVDNFAGGGGASTGIERAIGRPVDIAINHDPEAVAMHAQVRMIGNSVCPPLAEALVRANYSERQALRAAA